MINGRPAFDEALPVGLSLFDACLLQYDFREPDGIWVSCLSPRQHPSIFLVPLQYGGCETHSGDKVTESVAKNKISGDIFFDPRSERMFFSCCRKKSLEEIFNEIWPLARNNNL